MIQSYPVHPGPSEAEIEQLMSGKMNVMERRLPTFSCGLQFLDMAFEPQPELSKYCQMKNEKTELWSPAGKYLTRNTMEETPIQQALKNE